MPNTATFLDPKMLGFWLRCVRQAQKWSQEALAANAGVDVRTIQRMEAGKSINVTSRRAIATALGYDKPDAFEEPEFVKGVLSLSDAIAAHQKEELKKQHGDRVSLKTSRVTNGETLGRLAYQSNALSLTPDDDISKEAKIVAAELFDFLRDLLDSHNDLTFSQKVECDTQLGELLSRIEELGATAYEGYRSASVVGDHWEDIVPWWG